jgi:hypothetical protein
MRNLGRMLPRLILPAVIGLGLAYLATGFLPRPEPALRPPEELRAHGQGMDEDSPVRAILERNVLHLKSPPFTPPGGQPAAPDAPDAASAIIARPVKPDANWMPKAPALPQALTPLPAGKTAGLDQLSGGPSILGPVTAPKAPPAP